MGENKHHNSYSSVLTLVLACVLVFIVSQEIRWLYVGIALGIPSIFSRFVANKIDFIWMKLSFVLGKIVPNIILIVVYFTCLIPIAFLHRLIANNDELKLKNKDNSLFVNVSEKYDKSYFEKPW